MRSWIDAAALLALFVMIAWGVAGYGIWDPWELQIADAVRGKLSAQDLDQLRPPLADVLVRGAFGVLGVREWVGRVPFVVGGWLTCALAWWIVARYCGRRAGLIAAVVAACSPLLLLNARLMTGGAIGFSAQALIAIVAFGWTRAEHGDWTKHLAWGLALLASTELSILASGVLMGPLPPLLAVAVATTLGRGEWFPMLKSVGKWAAWLLSIVLVAGVVQAVMQDPASYSRWLGGGAVGSEPPTFDAVLEQIFHGFAPWSALLVAAAFAMPASAVSATDTAAGPDAAERSFLLMLALWAAFAYAATTVFASRYGEAVFPGVVALAGIVAVFIERSRLSAPRSWFAPVVAMLFIGLLIRDYVAYPESAVRAIAAKSVQLPQGFTARTVWAIGFAAFGLLAWLAMTTGAPASNRTNYRNLLQDLWQRSPMHRLWLSGFGVGLAAIVLVGALGWASLLPGPTVVTRAAREALLATATVAALVMIAPLISRAFARLGSARFVPMLLAGFGIAVYLVGFFQPELSKHFSPRDVFKRWKSLANEGAEPIATYGLSSSAADYYVDAPVQEIKGQLELISFLLEPGQRWAAFPTDKLGDINFAYRRRTKKHLFVVGADNARLTLSAGTPIEGVPNDNFLARTVLTEAPEPQHRVGANFDDRIELIGYSLELPHDDYVGAGESFGITWYWRVIGPSPGAYKIFVHIDAFGSRINADHVPVQDRYPVNLWRKGDVVIDEQTLKVPTNYRAGDYTLYVGLFLGSKRLPVKEGDHDGENRLKAGTLRVR